MKPATTTTRRPHATAVTILLYWLLLVCGLEGVTIVRAGGDGRDLAALWAGSLLGVALGQIFSWARLRGWLLFAIGLAGFWLTPVVYIALWELFHGSAETFALAFFPALVCGYLALSERGGFVAFWYPTVLWMMFILDGRGDVAARGSFDARASLPFAVGLAALFVAFLRVRESRRVALWRSHASARLASPRPPTVLRTSPLRAATQIAWTGAVGGAALALALWIAPHLWKMQTERRPAPPAATTASALATDEYASGGYGLPCCPDPAAVDKHVVVSEYFPLAHGEDAREPGRDRVVSCTTCYGDHPKTTHVTQPTTTGTGTSPGTFAGPFAGAADGVSDVYGAGYGGTYGGTYGGPGDVGSTSSTTPLTTLTTPDPQIDVAPPLPVPPKPKPGAHKAPAPHVAAPAVTHDDPPPVTTVAAATAAPLPSPPPAPAAKTVAPVDAGEPFAWLLALALAGVAMHFALRALRRTLTLRHLGRPFWPETLDQRVSNHWQRMIVGLRDAGIVPAHGEQPQAFARRVGIEGMETCASILERVRHGVRVDAGDLDAMGAAASSVYRAARKTAGPAGRAAAWLRWPLA